MTNKIKLELEVDSAGAIRSINGFNDAVTKGTKKSTTAVKGMGTAMSSALGYLGAIGASKAIGFITQEFTEAFRGAIQFEKAVAEINTLLPKTERLTTKTAQAFRELSATYGKDATTEAKAYYQIVSAGIKGTAKQLDTLSVSNESAIAGLTDVATSADVLTSVMNAYTSQNLSATEASDSLFVAVREGKTTFGELAGSIGQVAPIANNANLSFSELTGTLAQITKGGLSTAEATTGLKAVLTGIIKPSQEASQYAKQLGLDFNISAIKAKGFAGFLETVKDKTNGNTEALAKLFPNVRALGPLLGIVKGDFEGYRAVLDATANSLGATAEASKIMKETTDFKLDQATQSINMVTQGLADKLAPQIQLVTGYWSKLLVEMMNDEGAKTQEESVTSLTAKIANLAEGVKYAEKTMQGVKSGNFVTKMFYNEQEAQKAIDDAKIKMIEAESELASIRKKANDEKVRIGQQNSAEEFAQFEKDYEDGIALLDKKNETELIKKQEQFDAIRELQQADDALILEDSAMRDMSEQLSQDEHFQRLVAILGKEQATRQIYSATQLKDEAKRRTALQKIYLDADKKEEQQQKLADASKIKLAQAEQTAKLGILNATANLAGAILGNENKLAFAIAKGSAIANAYVAMQGAMAKSLLLSPLTGGEPFRTYAMVQGGLNIAAISATAIQGFQDGGIIQGASTYGDKNIARVNAGEMILNQRQQANLFNQANGESGNSAGNGVTVNVNVAGDFLSSDQTVDTMIDNINDAIELRNKQLYTA